MFAWASSVAAQVRAGARNEAELELAQASATSQCTKALRERQVALSPPRRDAPVGLAGLLGLLPELEFECPRAALYEWVEAVATQRRHHGLVRSFAAYQSAQLREHAGDLEAAYARYDGLGYLAHWWMVGPFDAPFGRASGSVQAPERRAFDHTQAFRGKIRSETINWQPFGPEHGQVDAFVDFSSVLAPGRDALAYASTWVRAPSCTDAHPCVFYFGSTGPYQVWINGVSVGQGETTRHPHPLQDAYLIALGPGWNEILVKVAVERGRWGFYARIGARGGEPISDLEVWPKVRAPAPEANTRAPWNASSSASPSPAAAHHGFDASHRLEDALRKGPRDATAALALARLHRWAEPFSADSLRAQEIAEYLDAHWPSPTSARLRAELTASDHHGDALLRAALEAARREGARETQASALLEASWIDAAHHFDRSAAAKLARARELAPDLPALARERAARLDEAGLARAAAAELERADDRAQGSRASIEALVRQWAKTGQRTRALARLEKLRRSWPLDASLIDLAIELYLQLGESERALALAHTALARYPLAVAAHVRVADIERSTGRFTQAAKSLAQAAAIRRFDAAIERKWGDDLAAAGQKSAALAAYRRSLVARPQQPDLQDLALSLASEGAAEDDMFTRHGLDLDAVLSSSDHPRMLARWRDRPAIRLRERVVVRLVDEGASERLEHRIIYINDLHGAKVASVQSMVFDPEQSYVEVRRAKVRRRDGALHDAGAIRTSSIIEAGYRTYFDLQQTEVHFTGLLPGDVVEVAFLRRDIDDARRGIGFSDLHSWVQGPQGAWPAVEVEYILKRAADHRIISNRPAAHETQTASGEHVSTFRDKAIEGTSTEPWMPGLAERGPYVHVADLRDWAGLADGYWHAIRGQLRPNAAIRHAVAQARASLPAHAGAHELAAALYHIVQAKTRYVGLRFGEHGYVPYAVAEVFARGFGDCKDKAALLKVMLDLADIPAHVTLVRSRGFGRVADTVPSLSVFDHAIVYVPSLDLYLDPTDDDAGIGDLPLADRDAQVLIVFDGRGGRFDRVPAASPDANRRVLALAIEVQRDGRADIRGEDTRSGSFAAHARASLRGAAHARQWYAAELQRMMPRADVRALEVSHLRALDRPIEFTTEYRVPAYAASEGRSLRFALLGRRSQWTHEWAFAPERVHPIVLPTPMQEHVRLKYTLPKSMRWRQVPRDIMLDGPFGSFALRVRSRDRVADVEVELELSRARIEAVEYPQFREFLRHVDAALDQTFEAEAT